MKRFVRGFVTIATTGVLLNSWLIFLRVRFQCPLKTLPLFYVHMAIVAGGITKDSVATIYTIVLSLPVCYSLFTIVAKRKQEQFLPVIIVTACDVLFEALMLFGTNRDQLYTDPTESLFTFLLPNFLFGCTLLACYLVLTFHKRSTAC